MAEALGSGPLTLTWSGRAVDAARIEAELVRLRYSAAGYSGAAEGAAIRTSLLNLVVHTTNETAANEASNTIAGLTGHHPSRALILIADASDIESRIDTRLAAHCHLTAGLEQQVCCEEVILNVHGRAAEHLHSIIIPLLVPDLPVYVWWTGALPRGHHLFEELIETADRFIIDSARFRHPTHGLSRVAELCRETPGCAIADMNWARLRIWRELMDQYDRGSEITTSVESVQIEYKPPLGDAVVPSDVFLLLGWLATRFEWATDGVQKLDEAELLLRHGDGRISVHLKAVDHHFAPPGSLVAVELAGRRGSLTLRRADDGSHVRVDARSLQRQVQETLVMSRPDPGELLVAELDGLQVDDEEFDTALQLALPVVQALNVTH